MNPVAIIILVAVAVVGIIILVNMTKSVNGFTASIGTATSPTVAVQVGAGIGGSASISSSTSSDGFAVTLNTGKYAAPSSNLFVVSLGHSQLPSGWCWSPGNATTSALYSTPSTVPFVSDENSTTMTFSSNTLPLADNSTYIFRFGRL